MVNDPAFPFSHQHYRHFPITPSIILTIPSLCSIVRLETDESGWTFNMNPDHMFLTLPLCSRWHISGCRLSVIKPGTDSIWCSAAPQPFECHFNCFFPLFPPHPHALFYQSIQFHWGKSLHTNMQIREWWSDSVCVEMFEQVGWMHTILPCPCPRGCVLSSSCVLMSRCLPMKWVMCVSSLHLWWSVRFPQIDTLVYSLAVVFLRLPPSAAATVQHLTLLDGCKLTHIHTHVTHVQFRPRKLLL